VAHKECLDAGVELGQLAMSSWTRRASDASAALVAISTESPWRPGRRRAAARVRALMLNPRRRLRSWSGPLTNSSRIWMSALVRAVRAERLATRKALTDSTGPSLDLAMLLALPPSAARAASMASRGSDLPLRRRSSRFGRLTSTTLTPARARNLDRPAP
jgi:hypothetical protein